MVETMFRLVESERLDVFSKRYGANVFRYARHQLKDDAIIHIG